MRPIFFLVAMSFFIPSYFRASITPRYHLLIYKSKRTLTLLNGPTTVRTYGIALGSSPLGPKGREGDMWTPQGLYRIVAKNNASKFHLSLQLNYPNIADAMLAKSSGVISSSDYEQIVKANHQRFVPPQHTPLGGDIFIHGGGIGKDWTWGCVALDNRDIEVLFKLLKVGTRVEINP
ncbi:MAG: L,D-transpeptidase family protein [Chthonomonadales bacterium]